MTNSRPVHDSSVLECRTRNQVNSGSNPPFVTVSKFGNFRFLERSNGLDTALYKIYLFCVLLLDSNSYNICPSHMSFHHRRYHPSTQHMNHPTHNNREPSMSKTTNSFSTFHSANQFWRVIRPCLIIGVSDGRKTTLIR